MREVILGTGNTFAEKLADARVEAGIAIWAIRFGDDWRAAWRCCPRPDWLIEMYMLGGRIRQDSNEHKHLVGLLERLVSAAAKDVKELAAVGKASSLVASWRVWMTPGHALQTWQKRWIEVEDQDAHFLLAVQNLAKSIWCPIAASLCVQHLSYLENGSPYSLSLAARLAHELNCPIALRVERLAS